MGYTEEESHSGKGCGFVISKKKESGCTGTLMQGFEPGKFRGKRIKLTAWAKSKGIKLWAGIWLRVDTVQRTAVAFDNMKDRPIMGTTDWTQYSLVLDVHEEANNIAFGLLLVGSGSLWADDFEFKTVSKKVPVTDLKSFLPCYSNEFPTNLDFSE